MEAVDEINPWPALADLLAASTLLFLILFAAIAVPAVIRGQQLENTLAVLDSTLTRNAAANRYEVRRVGDYLLVRIEGSATFPWNQYELRTLQAEGKRILASFAAAIRVDSLLQQVDQIQVVGHTSSEGSDERNWVLSASRAATVALFLIDSLQIPACQVSALGRSRYYPRSPAAAMQRSTPDPLDRRIELEIRPVIIRDTTQQIRRSGCVTNRGSR